MEYTKGEWKAAKTITGAEVGVDDDVIADVYSCHTGIALGNAYLIAAAPDMYEALKTISAFYSDTGYKTVFPSMVEAVRKVNRALAKAEGK